MPLRRLVANQLKVGIESWDEYGQREQTRREHLVELQTVFGFQPFTIGHYRQAVQLLTELAMQTDKGIVLARALIEHLRRQSVIVPALNAVERASAEAITRANRRLYDALAEPLTDVHRRRLDDLLKRRDNGKTTWLAWLRQSPVKPNSRHMLEHIERLKAWQALDLPSGIERLVHQNRLLKIAREGGQMTPADLAKFEPQRRYATLVALAIEGMATVTDEIIDLHDRILGKLFNAAKNKHQQQFQASGKAINAKVRLFGRIGQALIEAKQAGRDPFAAIEAVMSWDAFAESVTEAQRLAQPEDFDFLHRIGESYATLRRYAPEFLDVLKLRAAPAAKDVLDAIEVLRSMNSDNARKVPTDAPTEFIKPRWQKLVMTDTGIDRRYYELCALSELKNALRSGDIWVQGSRQFKDFEDYLVPPAKFASLKQASELPLAVATDCDQYLHDRLTLLETQLATVNRMAAGQRAAGRHHHGVGPEDHAARCGGARYRTGPDRPDGDDPTARQDHRIAAGGRRMDGLHPALRPPEVRRPGQGQKPVADHDPRRRDQPGPDQDGGIVPRHDLRQAGLAASLAHPRRNLRGGTGRAGQRAVPTSLRRALGRRHHVIVGRPELPHRQQGREHRPHQSEIWQQPRADVLHPYLRPVRAVPHQGRERRRARLDLRARRPAVSRIRPADRGALHRHGRVHGPRLRVDAPAGLPLRPAHS
jgi:hypothetical protein